MQPIFRTLGNLGCTLTKCFSVAVLLYVWLGLGLISIKVTPLKEVRPADSIAREQLARSVREIGKKAKSQLLRKNVQASASLLKEMYLVSAKHSYPRFLNCVDPVSQSEQDIREVLKRETWYGSREERQAKQAEYKQVTEVMQSWKAMHYHQDRQLPGFSVRFAPWKKLVLAYLFSILPFLLLVAARIKEDGGDLCLTLKRDNVLALAAICFWPIGLFIYPSGVVLRALAETEIRRQRSGLTGLFGSLTGAELREVKNASETLEGFRTWKKEQRKAVRYHGFIPALLATLLLSAIPTIALASPSWKTTDSKQCITSTHVTQTCIQVDVGTADMHQLADVCLPDRLPEIVSPPSVLLVLVRWQHRTAPERHGTDPPEKFPLFASNVSSLFA